MMGSSRSETSSRASCARSCARRRSARENLAICSGFGNTVPKVRLIGRSGASRTIASIVTILVHVDGRGVFPAWTDRRRRRLRSGGVAARGLRGIPPAAGDGADRRGERRDVVEHAECDEVIGPAGIVLSALAGADQDAVA